MFLKGKKVECFHCRGLRHYAQDCPSPKKISKSLCRQHGVIQTLKRVLPQLLKMQGMILMTC